MVAVLSQNAYPQQQQQCFWYSANASAILSIKCLEPLSNFKMDTPTTLRTPRSLPQLNIYSLAYFRTASQNQKPRGSGLGHGAVRGGVHQVWSGP